MVPHSGVIAVIVKPEPGTDVTDCTSSAGIDSKPGTEPLTLG